MVNWVKNPGDGVKHGVMFSLYLISTAKEQYNLQLEIIPKRHIQWVQMKVKRNKAVGM